MIESMCHLWECRSIRARSFTVTLLLHTEMGVAGTDPNKPLTPTVKLTYVRCHGLPLCALR